MEYTLIVLFFGGLGGYLGKKTKVPGGVVLGAMAFVVVYNMSGLSIVQFDRSMGWYLQVLAGVILGATATRVKFKALKSFLWPALCLTGGTLIIGWVNSRILVDGFNFDYVTSWLSAAPAQMQDMIIIAGNVDANVVMVASTHLARVLGIILVTPLILSVCSRFASESGVSRRGGL